MEGVTDDYMNYNPEQNMTSLTFDSTSSRIGKACGQ